MRRSRWRLPRGLGAAVLAAGVLTAGLPAGVALASQATPSAAAPQYTLDILTHVAALGHTWSLDVNEADGQVFVALMTTVKGVTEEHDWDTTAAFAPAANKDLKVTSTGHATFGTGSALNPVLGMSVSFTPTKAAKQACTKGSQTIYTGKVSGTVSLATGLRGVKFSVKFTGQPVGSLIADRSCVVNPPAIFPCSGSLWSLASGNPALGQVFGAQLGPKSAWNDQFGQEALKTASKFVTRSVSVSVNGPAPKLNTAAKTFSVSGLPSGALTGAAVISYSGSFPLPPMTCTQGGKKFKETQTDYNGTKVKVSKAFQAHSLLAGTVTMHTAAFGAYIAVKLTAA
jgi:hypothetical protein